MDKPFRAGQKVYHMPTGDYGNIVGELNAYPLTYELFTDGGLKEYPATDLRAISRQEIDPEPKRGSDVHRKVTRRIEQQQRNLKGRESGSIWGQMMNKLRNHNI